jgi:hypothetical protein
LCERIERSELYGGGNRQLHANSGGSKGIRLSDSTYQKHLRSAIPAMAVQRESSGWPDNDGMSCAIVVTCEPHDNWSEGTLTADISLE